MCENKFREDSLDYLHGIFCVFTRYNTIFKIAVSVSYFLIYFISVSTIATGVGPVK